VSASNHSAAPTRPTPPRTMGYQLNSQYTVCPGFRCPGHARPRMSPPTRPPCPSSSPSVSRAARSGRGGCSVGGPFRHPCSNTGQRGIALPLAVSSLPFLHRCRTRRFFLDRYIKPPPCTPEPLWPSRVRSLTPSLHLTFFPDPGAPSLSKRSKMSGCQNADYLGALGTSNFCHSRVPRAGAPSLLPRCVPPPSTPLVARQRRVPASPERCDHGDSSFRRESI